MANRRKLNAHFNSSYFPLLNSHSGTSSSCRNYRLKGKPLNNGQVISVYLAISLAMFSLFASAIAASSAQLWQREQSSARVQSPTISLPKYELVSNDHQHRDAMQPVDSELQFAFANNGREERPSLLVDNEIAVAKTNNDNEYELSRKLGQLMLARKLLDERLARTEATASEQQQQQRQQQLRHKYRLDTETFDTLMASNQLQQQQQQQQHNDEIARYNLLNGINESDRDENGASYSVKQSADAIDASSKLLALEALLAKQVANDISKQNNNNIDQPISSFKVTNQPNYYINNDKNNHHQSVSATQEEKFAAPLASSSLVDNDQFVGQFGEPLAADQQHQAGNEQLQQQQQQQRAFKRNSNEVEKSENLIRKPAKLTTLLEDEEEEEGERDKNNEKVVKIETTTISYGQILHNEREASAAAAAAGASQTSSTEVSPTSSGQIEQKSSASYVSSMFARLYKQLASYLPLSWTTKSVQESRIIGEEKSKRNDEQQIDVKQSNKLDENKYGHLSGGDAKQDVSMAPNEDIDQKVAMKTSVEDEKEKHQEEDEDNIESDNLKENSKSKIIRVKIHSSNEDKDEDKNSSEAQPKLALGSGSAAKRVNFDPSNVFDDINNNNQMLWPQQEGQQQLQQQLQQLRQSQQQQVAGEDREVDVDNDVVDKSTTMMFNQQQLPYNNQQQQQQQRQLQESLLGKYVYAPTQHYYLGPLPTTLHSTAATAAAAAAAAAGPSPYGASQRERELYNENGSNNDELSSTSLLPQHFKPGDQVFSSQLFHHNQQNLEPAYAYQKQSGAFAPLMLTTSQLQTASGANGGKATSANNDLYFLVMVGAFCIMAMAVVLAAGLFAYRIQQNRKLSESETEYPTYGVVGPNNMSGKCGAAAFVGGYFGNNNNSHHQQQHNSIFANHLANSGKSGSAKHLPDLYSAAGSIANGSGGGGTGSDSGLASLDNNNGNHGSTMRHCSNNNNGGSKKSSATSSVAASSEQRHSSMSSNSNQDAARMYHYQHQKQQMIVSDRSSAGRHNSASDLDSEDENDDGNYTVYECPGLASAHEMEIKNPIFNDERSP